MIKLNMSNGGLACLVFCMVGSIVTESRTIPQAEVKPLGHLGYVRYGRNLLQEFNKGKFDQLELSKIVSDVTEAASSFINEIIYDDNDAENSTMVGRQFEARGVDTTITISQIVALLQKILKRPVVVITGEKGDSGIPGLKGLPGKDGNEGLKGLVGMSGPVGQRGPDGKDGAPGANGDDGEKGLDKDIDATDGEHGTDGKDAAVGVEGPKGDIGLTGDQGTIGADGDPGV